MSKSKTAPERPANGHPTNQAKRIKTQEVQSPFIIGAERLRNHPGWDDFLEAMSNLRHQESDESEEVQSSCSYSTLSHLHCMVTLE